MKQAQHLALTALLAGAVFTATASAHLIERTKLLPSDGAAGDQFGISVATDGQLAVVGAPFHVVGTDQGAVYVFQRTSPTTWPEVAKLTPTGAGPLDLFGVAVAIDGAFLAVSAPKAGLDAGAVYIFTGSGASWTQTQVLTASDTAPGQTFGAALALDGDTLAIGAPGAEATYVFRETAGTWTEEQKVTMTSPTPGDEFGISVSLWGDELLVGAPFEDTDGPEAGSAYLFTRSGSTWTQQLRFGSATPGAGDRFGRGVCIGSIFVGVGAPYDDDSGTDSGAAHYFRRNGSGWDSEGTLTSIAAPTAAGDHVGETILVDTNLFLIGQPDGDLQGADSGGSQTFIERGDGILYGDVMFPTDTTTGDNLGKSIAQSGCWLLAGAPNDDDLGTDSGSAYVFLGTPLTTLYCLPGISGQGCVATLSAAGTASASQASGFTVTASGVDGGVNGLFFYGKNGSQQNSWGNGTSFQCVVPPVIRMGLITSTGPDDCTGQFSQDLNATWCSTCPRPAKNPGPGVDIYLQLWYRDPTNTSNQSTSLSNAAVIGVCP